MSGFIFFKLVVNHHSPTFALLQTISANMMPLILLFAETTDFTGVPGHRILYSYSSLINSMFHILIKCKPNTSPGMYFFWLKKSA